jgi:hypothetical protein
LKGQEDINDKLIGDVLEAILEVGDSSLRVLFEYLVLGVHLVKFVCDGAADNFGQDLLYSLLVRVFVDCLDTVSLVTRLLAHLTDLFVNSLDGDALNLADRDAIECHLILVGCRFVLGVFHALLHLSLSEEASLARLVEPSFKSFVLTFGVVHVYDVESGVSHADLVCNPLNFMLFHLLGDGSAQILGAVLLLVPDLLLLNFSGLVVNPKNYGYEFF